MRRRCRCLGAYDDYAEIVGAKAKEAIDELRGEASKMNRRAEMVERAWRAWDFDQLVALGVVSREVAQRAEAARQVWLDEKSAQDYELTKEDYYQERHGRG